MTNGRAVEAQTGRGFVLNRHQLHQLSGILEGLILGGIGQHRLHKGVGVHLPNAAVVIHARARRTRSHLINNAVDHTGHFRNMYGAASHLFTHLDPIITGQSIQGSSERIGPSTTEHQTQPQNKDMLKGALQQLLNLDQGLTNCIGGVRLVGLTIWSR